jgi:hypothetical protein
MKFMLVILITVGVSNDTKYPPKTIEMRIPQENQEECLKSSKTFKFSLPVVDMYVDTRCELRKDNEEPKIRGVET